jgi:hypothetical protein
MTPISASFDGDSLIIKSKAMLFQAPVGALGDYMNLYGLCLAALFL